MSRAAASKTRGMDKTKPPASQTPVITHEIVPGKFNDGDWNFMVERDTADEFIHDIMDELMENTMTAIYERYIEHQLLPFTITQAREAMVEIIEWRFLANDQGEESIETDLGWAEDEEPEPAVTDCWAQGSVPKNIISAPTPPLEDIVEEVEKEMVETTEMAAEAQTEVSQEPPELADYVSDTEEVSQEPSTVKGVKKEEPKVVGKVVSTSPKKKFRPYRGKLKSAGVSKMTESLEETEMQMIYNEISASMPPTEDKPSTLLNMPASCTSILKVQTGRPPGNKDVIYDELGNVVAVMKLDPEKLPSHKISVKYHVVDPAVEAAQARLDAMRKGKSTGKKKKVKSSKVLTNETVSSHSTVAKSTQSHPSGTVAPLPPPLIEEMEVSHGVIVREGGRVKKGPGRYYRKYDVLEESQKGMKPINIHLANPDITVEDLLDRHTPILRPLGDSSPLPPIVPQPPPMQSQQA